MQTTLRAHGRGFHAELRYRVREGERKIDVGHVVVVVAAIQSVIGKITLSTGNRDHSGTLESLTSLYVIVLVGVHGAAHKGDQRRSSAGR